MSLNRIELALYDYVKTHPEERQYWRDKVRALAAEHPDPHVGAARIDAELRRYLRERSSVLPESNALVRGSGPPGTSLRNLAEFLLRLWAEPRARKPAQPGGGAFSGGGPAGDLNDP